MMHTSGSSSVSSTGSLATCSIQSWISLVRWGMIYGRSGERKPKSVAWRLEGRRGREETDLDRLAEVVSAALAGGEGAGRRRSANGPGV